MTKVKVYNLAGKEVSEISLDPKVFGVKLNENLVLQALDAQESSARIPYAHAKTKGEIRGGGKKPWRQKGTGRARHGSTRNPQWRGGGVAFGPRSDRNFSKDLSRKMKRAALLMVLSDKAADDKIIIVDSLQLKEAKTKEVTAALKNLKINKSVLMAHTETNEALRRASSNLGKVSIARADSLNVLDIVKSDRLVIEQSALPIIEKTFVRK